MNAPLPLSRRGFGYSLATIAAAGFARPISLLAKAPSAMTPPPAATPVVAFHMDALYIDWTGTAEPYRPPEGRRASGLEDLADHELHGLYGWA